MTIKPPETNQQQLIPLSHLRPSRWQPRQQFDPVTLEELALSIKTNGLINPPLVFPIHSDGRPFKVGKHPPSYELIAGERRLRAVVALAWTNLDPELELADTIACLADDGFHELPDPASQLLNGPPGPGLNLLCQLVVTDDLQRLHRLVVAENLDRQNLSPLEEATALQGLVHEHNWSQRVLANQLHRSQSWISKRLALLELAPEVKDAMIPRGITPKHAEAIARVPPELQPAVAAWALESGDKNEPVTTRDLDVAARQLARFVDPQRYNPNPETTYHPRTRNRLLLIQYLLEGAHLAPRTGRLLALRDRPSYDGGNLLSKQPKTVARETSQLHDLLDALGLGDRKLDDLWLDFAAATNRDCTHCRFATEGQAPPDLDTIVEKHCPAWRHPEKVTCQSYIGPLVPVGIPRGWDLRSPFSELKLPVQLEPFPHLASVPAYCSGYRAAAAHLKEKRDARRREKETAHLAPLQAYLDYQSSLPPHALAHFHAHACHKCLHYLPSLSADDPSAITLCRFAHQPLLDTYDKSSPRPPAFGVLVDPDGTILPRCEQFTYRTVPELHTYPGTVLVDRPQVIAWIREFIKGGYHSSPDYLIPYVFAWLPYPRPDGKHHDLDALCKYLLQEWDQLGGDPVVPTLIDLAIDETRLRQSSSLPFTHLNPVSNTRERFAYCNLDVAAGTDQWPDYRPWPDDFPKPWGRGDCAASSPSPTD